MNNETEKPIDPNETRRRRAEVALTIYMNEIGVDEPEDSLVDLFTDLRHWCKKHSLTQTFDEAIERSLEHFEVETIER